MKNNTLLTATLLAALTVATFTGCSTTEETPTPTPPVTETETPKQDNTDTDLTEEQQKELSNKGTPYDEKFEIPEGEHSITVKGKTLTCEDELADTITVTYDKEGEVSNYKCYISNIEF